MITHKREFDLAKPKIVSHIFAVQGEGNTRSLEAKLFENGAEWTPPSDASIAVAFKKPDGTRGVYDRLPNGGQAITATGNTVTAILAPQVLTCPGEVKAALLFVDQNGNKQMSFPFCIMVAEDPSAGADVSNNYFYFTSFDAINDAIGDMSKLETDDKTSLVAAINAASRTGGSVSNEQIANAVEEYLKENPIEGGGTAGQDGFSPVANVNQTSSGATITITDKSGTTTATVTNGKDGADGQPGKDGADGQDGTSASLSIKYARAATNSTEPTAWQASIPTLTPTEKYLWAQFTKTQGLSASVWSGVVGVYGDTGADGVSPTVAVSKSGKVTTVSITDKNGTKTATINDGADGSAGSAGKDGTSVTHSWSGTTLNITSASGTSSANLKGEKGDKGDTGATGATGPKPVKGTDYWTEADKVEMVNAVIAALPVYNGEVV